MQGQNAEANGIDHHSSINPSSVVPVSAGGSASGREVAVTQGTGESAALISMIERAARDPSVDIDKFERLMLMKERVERQNAVKAFNDAISAAKGEIGPIVKNRTVDFTSQKGRTHYKHEDFAGIASAIDPVLKRYGLAYRFRSSQNGSKLGVTCILSHVQGHAEETSLETGEDHSGNKNATQAIGSAATYLQRYTLKLALGLASSHDDDARGSAGADTATITDEQAEQIKDALDDAGITIPQFAGKYKLAQLTDLPASRFDESMKAIAAAAKKRSVQ